MRQKQRQIIAMFTLLTMLLPLFAGCGSEVSDLPEKSTQGTEVVETTEVPEPVTSETTIEVPTTEEPTTEEPTTEEPETEPVAVEPIEEFVIPEFEPVIGVTEVIAAQYDEAWPFSEGYAVVGMKQGESMKYNYIDTEGQLLLDEWVDIALSFSEGLACVGFDAGITVERYHAPLYRFGYVDTTGEMAIPAEILCYEGHYPRAFYDGYAEIFSVDPDGEEMKIDYQGIVVKSNVIDREGNRLFDVELSYLSSMYAYGYYRGRERVLPIEAEKSELDYCLHNEWVRNRLSGGDGSSFVSSQLEGITYLVDAEGKIERTFQGSIYELGEDYYVLYPKDGGNKALYDRKFNLISEEEYRSLREGIDGQIIVSVKVTNEYGAEREKNQVLDRGLTPVSGLYDDIQSAGTVYIGKNFGSQGKYELFGTDGQVIHRFAEELDVLQHFSDGYYGADGYCRSEDGFFIGTDLDRTGGDNDIKYYYSSTGELFHSGKDAVCRQVSDDLFCIGIKGGKGQLINREFEVLLELPRADVINYAGDEENVYLCHYDGDVVYWYHLSMEDGIWKIAEEGTEEKATFNRTVEGWRFTADENEISRIISETEYDGPAVLEWKDGTVLDEGKAVSLVADGLYLVAENQEYVETYGYDAWNYCLKSDGEAVSEVYEELDVASEGHIAFCQDGKWGYLKIEREAEEIRFTGEATMQKIELEKAMLADLDGDGVAERITITANSEDRWLSAEEVKFQIDDLCYTGDALDELLGHGWIWLYDGCFWLSDLDTTDGWIEIAIKKCAGASPGTDTKFFRYHDGELVILGETNGTPEPGDYYSISVPGDGTVSANVYCLAIQTTTVVKTWKLADASVFDTKLDEIKQEYYEYQLRDQDAKMTLKQEMTFFAQKDGNTADLVMLPAGTKIDIARYYPEEGWIQIVYDQDTKSVWLRKTEDGLILPMSVPEWEMSEYIDRLYLAG